MATNFRCPECGAQVAEGASCVEFLEKGLPPQEARRQNRQQVSSSQRNFKIKATPQSHGVYAHPVPWRLTAADVTAGTVDTYCENVRAWAQATLESLKSSGKIP